MDLYHASKVAVIPSLYEGFGFGAGEAMSCGVPLISTHSGGLKDVVGDSAIKIQPGSTVDIERAVIQLFQNPLQRKELSEKGRKRIEELLVDTSLDKPFGSNRCFGNITCWRNMVCCH